MFNLEEFDKLIPLLKKLDLLISRLKGLSSVTDWLRWSDDDRYYAMLCSHYAMLLGGGGKV